MAEGVKIILNCVRKLMKNQNEEKRLEKPPYTHTTPITPKTIGMQTNKSIGITATPLTMPIKFLSMSYLVLFTF
jgi:hypothetical protein